MSSSDSGTGKAPQSLLSPVRLVVSGAEGEVAPVAVIQDFIVLLLHIATLLHCTAQHWAELETHIVFTGMSDSCGYNQNDWTVSIWSISPSKWGHYKSLLLAL